VWLRVVFFIILGLFDPVISVPHICAGAHLTFPLHSPEWPDVAFSTWPNFLCLLVSQLRFAVVGRSIPTRPAAWPHHTLPPWLFRGPFLSCFGHAFFSGSCAGGSVRCPSLSPARFSRTWVSLRFCLSRVFLSAPILTGPVLRLSFPFA